MSVSEQPVRLIKVLHEVEAAIIASSLAENGIEAHITGEHTSGMRAETPGMVQVWVHRIDLEKAREVLAEIKQQSSEIDWDQVDVGEAEQS